MVRKLGRKKDHREHMERNLLTSLVLYEKIDTTKAKAKEILSSFDRLISSAKKNDTNTRQSVNNILFDKKAVEKVFDILLPRYKNRNSGYTSMVVLYNRKGDNSTICRLELLDKSVLVDSSKVSTKLKSVEIKKEVK